MTGKHVLIAGASGLVGYAALKHFAGLPGVRVTGVSRRPPFGLDDLGIDFLSADLRDQSECEALFGAKHDVTHVVYAALHEQPALVAGWREEDQITTNDRMLRHLLGPLARAASGLRHVTLLQGTKAYGAHVRRFDLPAREGRSEARDVPNFYWNQEDYLKECQRGAGWAWTIIRPQIIFGQSFGSAMNPIPAIGVYAALLRERGEPLYYPGGPSNVLEAVDADLLARAIAWAGEADAARNETFNVTNGDVFQWSGVWPAIADALGMEPGPPRPRRLAETMPAEALEWERIRQRYGLVAPPMADYMGASLQYLDYLMAHGSKAADKISIVSTVKIRHAGFGEAMDTEAMFRKWFNLFESQKLLPPAQPGLRSLSHS
jgi:nucleoside-diphosphate-sugar epimerase